MSQVEESQDVVCRGSYALGTACNKCLRCKAERDRIKRAAEWDSLSVVMPASEYSEIRYQLGYLQGVLTGIQYAPDIEAAKSVVRKTLAEMEHWPSLGKARILPDSPYLPMDKERDFG